MLDPGMILVVFQASGPQKMTVDFSCGTDWGAYSGLDLTGPYNGTFAFQVPGKEVCAFNISGSGAWTAQVNLPDMTTPLEIPGNLSGSGTDVTSPFMLQKGQYLFQREETGLASPLYELRYANGSYLNDANNTYVQPGFGLLSAETFRFIEIPESGTYFMSVLPRTDPSPWNASIIISPTIPPMGMGPVMNESRS
jgi:hypothetical protein